MECFFLASEFPGPPRVESFDYSRILYQYLHIYGHMYIYVCRNLRVSNYHK